MSTTELERLVRDYDGDAALRARLDSAADLGRVTELALAAGYDVTVEEVQARHAARPDAATELTGRQLDAVAGGGRVSVF